MTSGIKVDRQTGRIRDKRTGRFVKVAGLTRITVSDGWLFLPDNEPDTWTPPPADKARWGEFA